MANSRGGQTLQTQCSIDLINQDQLVSGLLLKGRTGLEIPVSSHGELLRSKYFGQEGQGYLQNGSEERRYFRATTFEGLRVDFRPASDSARMMSLDQAIDSTL